MRIQVLADDGSTTFEYDTTKGSQCLFPAMAVKPSVAAALTEATTFLAGPASTIRSIEHDISLAAGRIETELGAHPAYTWAQTALGYARAHLQHYVDDRWEEPQFVPGVTIDARGVVLAAGDSTGPKSTGNKLDWKFYGEIRKAKNDSIVPDDEYVVFLAKDNAFVTVLPLYLEACISLGCDKAQIAAIQAMIGRVFAWREANREKLKNPDVAAGEKLLG